MSSNPFDAGQQSQFPGSAPEEHKTNGATPSGEVQELLDPNDPRLVSEDLNANPDADAYAQPAPPPDGKYRVKLKLMRSKDGQGQEVNYLPKLWGKAPGQAVFVAGVQASIIDPSGKYDNLSAYDYNVSTFIGRDNATKVTTILNKLRKPDGSPWVAPHTKMAPKAWMDTLVRALAGEPELGIETQWEYSCADCGKAAKQRGEAYPRSVQGMHKFPPEPDKTKRAAGQLFSPEMKCTVNAAHGYGRARITIARFMSLDELKK
jgi:hypothetical protein